MPDSMDRCFAGIDVGSTTVKFVLLDKSYQLVYHDYQRHFSEIQTTLLQLLENAWQKFPALEIIPTITGSGGLALSTLLGIPFEQEVLAGAETISTVAPDTDVAIELGGEDAKITYFDKGQTDQRMNNTCAGGTGAFIDQMASLLETDASGLNLLAEHHKTLYPIASRCGVFAKTDVQPLINQGAAREDIAASILQAIVKQTITSLACGKPIRGKVAFLGGPLHFLSNLRKLFISTLQLPKEDIFFPEHSQLFVGIGAALLGKQRQETLPLDSLVQRLRTVKNNGADRSDVLPPLFSNPTELAQFRERHAQATVLRTPLQDYQGATFLGIDSGSTTTKLVLIGAQGELLYDYYSTNKGDPLRIVRAALQELYSLVPEGVSIAMAASTGYGEQLIKAAFRIDTSEVETVAHYKAAEHILPGVEFILDIGGQDMKCLTIRDGIINTILLNEACSAGCGSFIEMFASSLLVPVQKFAADALLAPMPVDLGTRCTVFMNSKVKQAQKEGASIANISAGLSYSVIKNALYKVIKLKRFDMLPKKIMLQGGTFHNEAVLRAFEKITEREVIRVDIAGLMGAYGAALIAREQATTNNQSTLLPPCELEAFSVRQSNEHCKRCNNQCRLTISTFTDNSEFVSGNRCEKGSRVPSTASELPNLYAYKTQRLFNYRSLPAEEAIRGTVGIPRVLSMYENYPLWHTFLTELGFRVLLSPPSSERLYLKGIATIPSESACYPAKLVHGHIEYLLERKVDRIFFPSVTYEWQEFSGSDKHFNCPIAGTYAELIRNNIDAILHQEIPFHYPFLNLNNKKSILPILHTEFSALGISKGAIKRAVELGVQEMQTVRADIRNKGAEVVAWLAEKNISGIVLSGRPYHTDPGVHHGIDRLIIEEGMAVLTEDSVAHLGDALLARPLRVLDQWSYQARLYTAAAYVAATPQLEMIQLTSFGCGLDAVTAEQTEEVLAAANKIHMLIKIDEGANLGAARIRIRSLKAAIEARQKQKKENNFSTRQEVLAPSSPYRFKKAIFTEAMRETHTILAPQMAPIQFELLEPAFQSEGYKLQLLRQTHKKAVDLGLQYVNNDACYPCVLVTGQIIEALQSGNHDPHYTAAIISQTGGACRASNYIAFIRKALADAGFPQVPVISVSASGIEDNPGFSYSVRLIKKAIMAIIYGDVLAQVLFRTRPYEVEKGAAARLFAQWNERCKEHLRSTASMKEFKALVAAIVAEFDTLPLQGERKPRVGIVGEILVKFHPDANNNLSDLIEAEGAEVVLPDLLEFVLSCTYSTNFEFSQYGIGFANMLVNRAITKTVEWMREAARQALERSERFTAPLPIAKVAALAENVVSLGNQAGEGWLLTAEMVELLKQGVNNIICVQPFGCLPNHITGRGVIKSLKELYPMANISAIDYDPGASEVNQLNRLKLMLSVAHNKTTTPS